MTIGGGFGKIVKLAQGALDLHSGRSQVDFDWLANLMPDFLRARIIAANTAQEVLDICAGLDLPSQVAHLALQTVRHVLREAPVAADIVIVGRKGGIIGRAA